jgi:hypothetical protein
VVRCFVPAFLSGSHGGISVWTFEGRPIVVLTTALQLRVGDRACCISVVGSSLELMPGDDAFEPLLRRIGVVHIS